MGLWNKPNEPEIKPNESEVKPPEKTPAELIADSLKPLVDGFNTFKQDVQDRLTAFEQANRKPEPQVNAETPSVWDNEEAAFATRLGPVMLRQFELEARMVRQDIRREYEGQGFGDMWAQFEEQINAQLDNSALVQPDGRGGVRPLRGDPAYIRNVVNMIIGQAAVKSGMRFDGKSKSFFLETGGSDGSSHPTGDQLEGLSADQARLASRMGVPLADAKKAIAKAKFVN